MPIASLTSLVASFSFFIVLQVALAIFYVFTKGTCSFCFGGALVDPKYCATLPKGTYIHGLG